MNLIKYELNRSRFDTKPIQNEVFKCRNNIFLSLMCNKISRGVKEKLTYFIQLKTSILNI